MLIFFKTDPLIFNTLIPSTFPLVEARFQYGPKFHHHISFNVIYVFKSNPSDEFSIQEQEKK